jgi:hypothetical protein
MIDPWEHLNQWNKPANVDQKTFDLIYQQAMEKTAFANEKISVLRGKTIDVIYQIPDQSLDLIYIDGDHTLKGVAIDLISSFGKVKPAGIIGGDDFCRTIWQHESAFEPTLVFPFSVYFAEATKSRIYALPFNQFVIQKAPRGEESYHFIDLTGRYRDLTLLGQFQGKRTPRRRNRVKILRKIRSSLMNILK